MKSIRLLLHKISQHISDHQIHRGSAHDARSEPSSNAVLTDMIYHFKRYTSTNLDHLRTYINFETNFDLIDAQQTQMLQQIALLCLSLVTVFTSHYIFRRLSNRNKSPRSSCKYTNGDSYKGEILHGKKHGWGVVSACVWLICAVPLHNSHAKYVHLHSR